jgi:hypothetical protein
MCQENHLIEREYVNHCKIRYSPELSEMSLRFAISHQASAISHQASAIDYRLTSRARAGAPSPPVMDSGVATRV